MERMQTADEQKQILADNLNNLLRKKGKTQADVIRDTGLAEATVRSWFNGEKYPRLDKIQTLSDYFNVPRSRITEEQTGLMERISSLVKIPVLGVITCGEPILAEENIEEFREEIADLMPTGSVFYLKTKGQSMVPTIPEGSYVLIKEQPIVEDGEIAAVLLNGDTEATLKRIKRQGETIMLIPDNKEFTPIIVNSENPARIIGKAIKVSYDL